MKTKLQKNPIHFLRVWSIILKIHWDKDLVKNLFDMGDDPITIIFEKYEKHPSFNATFVPGSSFIKTW